MKLKPLNLKIPLSTYQQFKAVSALHGETFLKDTVNRVLMRWNDDKTRVSEATYERFLSVRSKNKNKSLNKTIDQIVNLYCSQMEAIILDEG